MFSRALHILNASMLQPSPPRFQPRSRSLPHTRQPLSTTVASHIKDRPSFQGTRVWPSGLFPCDKSGKARRFPDRRSASSVEATKDYVVYVAVSRLPTESKRALLLLLLLLFLLLLLLLFFFF